jgi:phosphoglycolate phosphatase-like HAD superfamily hydrolase
MQANTLGRRWDDFEAYLFDIDGTLMNCTDAVHYFAFNDALSAVAGRPVTIDGVVAHGNVDVGILRDAFAAAGVEEEHWRPRLPEILERMRGFVAERQSEFCISLLPSVREVLEHLRSRGAIVGTATGNLQAIGEVKLNRVGLLDLFDFGGWSDSCETRAEVFRKAAAQARNLAQKDISLCALGDTPADVLAARANDLKVIAVSTGIYSYETLAAEKPDLLVGSLTELLESTMASAAAITA